MPHLVRLYIRQVIAGFGLAAFFVGGLLALNVANLGHLVSSVQGGWIAVAMLWLANGVVFAGVQFALALPSGRDGGGGSGRARPVFLAEPVPVRIDTRRR
ncbi:hypothetical protein [Mangrovicoccus algicola]|uniref:Uncharacterized protein n=1 Tax=Mangrovicoccus algicola TaxID=2771008 RepID=A0A8J6YY14_9RHOB|nr:hypothetical protein [Mangrovicoccus algicola]MBE3639847.1 hypothetical protein [Mangrovicoccus algicola]